MFIVLLTPCLTCSRTHFLYSRWTHRFSNTRNVFQDIFVTIFTRWKSNEKDTTKISRDFNGRSFYPILVKKKSMDSCSRILQSELHSVNSTRRAEILWPPWGYCYNPDQTLKFICNLQCTKSIVESGSKPYDLRDSSC